MVFNGNCFVVCDSFVMVLEFSVMFYCFFFSFFFNYFYIMHFKSFKKKKYIYIYCLNTSLIMNQTWTWNLKEMCGLRFHPFFIFGAGLLMSFHEHSCLSIMIICFQLQTWGVSTGCRRGNGLSRFFFWATGMVTWFPTQTAYSAY